MNSVLNVKALAGTFNQEKALVGAFSVIVETDCETDRSFHSYKYNWRLYIYELTICRARWSAAWCLVNWRKNIIYFNSFHAALVSLQVVSTTKRILNLFQTGAFITGLGFSIDVTFNERFACVVCKLLSDTLTLQPKGR